MKNEYSKSSKTFLPNDLYKTPEIVPNARLFLLKNPRISQKIEICVESFHLKTSMGNSKKRISAKNGFLDMVPA